MFLIFMVSLFSPVSSGRSVASQLPGTKAATMNYLDLASGKRLAYEKVEGSTGLPTVVYVPGYRSGMEEDKPVYLRNFCIRKNYTFIR